MGYSTQFLGAFGTMEVMTTYSLWIAIAAVVLVILIVGIIIVGNKRKSAKSVSFEKTEEPKELTQQEKSGNYQAKGGFNFAQAGVKEKEPIPRVDAPSDPKPAQAVPMPEPEPLVDEEPASVPAPEPEPVEETQSEKPEPVAVPEPQADSEPAVEPKPEVEKEPEPTLVAEEPKAPAPAEPASDEADVEHQDIEEAQEAADAAAATVDGAERALEDGAEPTEDAIVSEPVSSEPVEAIAPAAGRMGKLRGRLSRSQNAIGQGLLGILTAGDLDEDAWEEIEDTLIMADIGADLTMRITDALRQKIAERGVASEAEARAMLRETLIEAAKPELDRSIHAMPNEGKPAVILVVGVNGTGKTTTTGKLARVLVAMGHSVVLGAADTFRAAAADQLETWGRRVGASTVRGAEGADPASVAFDAVATGVQEGADVVLVDTAGRLHTSTGLMDQLGKVKRVVEKKSTVDEVLLVLDATVGQNGIAQARVFRDVVDITGVVLTKLDGTAKGGIVFQVQEELGVPVKLVGLGEGADDLAPFEVESFVDALLG